MMRRLLYLFSLVLLAGCAPQRPADVDDEKVALLHIHQADIRAHRDRAVDTLLLTIPEDMIVAGDGQVFHQSRDQVHQFFTGYLEGAEYTRYEDLMVPHVEVSDDGTMGWIISRTAVERTEPDPGGGRRARAFTYAGIMTYENRGEGWVKVANVSSFAPDLDNAELAGLAEEDQGVLPGKERRTRVFVLLAEGKVRTARDKYNAARILHRSGPAKSGGEAANPSMDNHLLAHELAVQALAGGEEAARELAAVRP